MSSSERIAVAAHLHVLLRRKTGRVTDTEWMATNQEYAHEIAQLAREKSAEEGNAELGIWADKLEEVMRTTGPAVARPLIQRMSEAAKVHGARSLNSPPQAAPADASRAYLFVDAGIQRQNEPRYVKGLR
ncbi:MAG: hypothetical protein JWR60_3430 [Polaromonas sp.]|nr:hypothetical protein [Polaromonas sp.]